jgi:osmotically-inducible protein OsmY
LKRLPLVLLSCFSLLAIGSFSFAQDPAPAPNNTGVNARDRNAEAVTADQQSNSKSDMEITRRIRRAVVKDDALSMMAHNVKIITVNGTVTLRGPVKTEKEKVVIARKARAVSGVDRVRNQLKVEAQ